MFDKFNRNITYLRISVTDKCNLRCTYCMPAEGVQPKSHNDILSHEKIVEAVKVAVSFGIKKIRITGGEPLIRKGLLSLISQLKQIQDIEELTITTNGVLLESMAKPLKDAGIDRINISLDTLDEEKYKQLTRIGDIRYVLAGIDAAIEAGFKNTKINMVLIPGFNDNEVEKMQEFCNQKKLLLQRINHYSLNTIHSIDRSYHAERPMHCGLCNRIRLTCDGKLKPCLFSELEIPLDFSNLPQSFLDAINMKPEKGSQNPNGHNWEIGG